MIKPTPPRVSIVIPVYNESKKLPVLLEALRRQTFPSDQLEIIVVDNNSSDDSASVIQSFPVHYVLESEVQGSYAARNTGVRHSRGEMLAFTDADCRPDLDWVETALKALEESGADLLAGKIDFTFSEERSNAEIYDSLCNLQHGESVAERGVAFTANLFVRRRVFEKLGGFSSRLVSSGDLDFTRRAKTAGYVLKYAPGARVRHQARRFPPLMKKAFRIGRGKRALAQTKTQTTGSFWQRPQLKIFVPRYAKQRLQSAGLAASPYRLVALWLCAVCYLASAALGSLTLTLRSRSA